MLCGIPESAQWLLCFRALAEEEEAPSHDVLFIASACDAAGGQEPQAEDDVEFNHDTVLPPNISTLLLSSHLFTLFTLTEPLNVLSAYEQQGVARCGAPYWPKKEKTLIHTGTYPFLTAANNEVGFYVVLLQVGVPLPPCSRLHVIVPVQIVQGCLGDVDASEKGRVRQ